jgi:nitrogen fixation protein NifU and related proteins
MNDKLDIFIDRLQSQIFDEAKGAFGEAGFQRWQTPEYMGRMQNCDASARVTGECGDTMEIFLRFAENRVQDASYFTDGCASSSICGSFTAEMAMGKDPDELTEITGGAVLEKIGRFPEKDQHCAYLAAETLQEALRCHMIREREKT